MKEALYPAFGILLVDDEPPWLRSLSMTLEGPGAITNITQLSDSRQVMPLLARQEIGLVLLGVTLLFNALAQLLLKTFAGPGVKPQQ